MNLQTILVPTDFSEPSKQALAFAVSLARDAGARLLIVHVKEDTAVYAEHATAAYPVPSDEYYLKQMLAAFAPDDPSVTCTQRLLHGAVADCIVGCAQEEHADVIVIGSHGRSGLSRLILGSVAEGVVRRAACPVLTVKSSSV